MGVNLRISLLAEVKRKGLLLVVGDLHFCGQRSLKPTMRGYGVPPTLWIARQISLFWRIELSCTNGGATYPQAIQRLIHSFCTERWPNRWPDERNVGRLTG
jgi:hypothetical protein